MTIENGQWTIVVSPAGMIEILIRLRSRHINCQLSTVNCQLIICGEARYAGAGGGESLRGRLGKDRTDPVILSAAKDPTNRADFCGSPKPASGGAIYRGNQFPLYTPSALRGRFLPVILSAAKDPPV